MSKPKVYDVWDPPEDPGVDASEGIGADQSFREECDINVIMARANRTGELPGVQGAFGEFADVSDAPDDYLAARNFVRDAEERFMQLPPKVRQRFAGDPYEILRFVSDPANRDEAIELGLIERPPAEPVKPTEQPADKPAA